MTNGPFHPDDLDAEALLQQMRGGPMVPKAPKVAPSGGGSGTLMSALGALGGTSPAAAAGAVRESPSGSFAGPRPPTSNTMPIGGDRTVLDMTGGTNGGFAPPGARAVLPDAAPSTPPAASGVQPSTFQGFTPRHAMEGFAFDREQNTGKSAKDAFAYLANQAPPPPINDKQALGAWFKQYIEPGMNQLGHQVLSVDGDKFRFKNWQGEFDVDYGRGAGAEGGALAWQVDDGSAQMANGAYQPSGPGAASAIGAVRGPTADQPTAMADILAEIEALQSGGVSPMDSNALLALLRA